jgi:hypothetical protein
MFLIPFKANNPENCPGLIEKIPVMATQQGVTSSTEAAILSRLIHPERDDLPSEAAQAKHGAVE